MRADLHSASVPSELNERRVLILDDDADLCDLLQLLFEEQGGVRCVVVHSVAELRENRGRALDCELAILDMNLGPRQATGLDALDWLEQNHFAGTVAFLTGHARRDSALQDRAATAGLAILEKPVEPSSLVALLESCRTAAPSVTP